VSIRGLTRRFGSGKSQTVAVDHLDVDINPGELLVLLGPSGCGKTTTLRCIAGLESPDEGRIQVGDRTFFDAASHVDLATNKRNIGMVFQSYALWPHMTVARNIGYPLRARRVDRKTAAQWIKAAAESVDCGELLDRYPAQLSGGQQQRVALGRGLVARPELMLFDEPLSNLDARLRDQVRTEIHELHRRLRFTAVYVTHDQLEALALGDRLAIMRSGAIEQLATPEEIFEEPASEYVAEFIGMPNRLGLEWRNGAWRYRDDVIERYAAATDDSPARDVAIGRARAESLRLTPPGEPVPSDVIAFPATVVDSEFMGQSIDVVVASGKTRLKSRMPAGERGSWSRSLEAGQPILGLVRPSDIVLFDTAGGRIARGPAANTVAAGSGG
jgi:iron(III) transport system ATP-binding protein